MAAARDPDYYAVLGVPETASNQEITRAYRRLVRRLHPDANRSADPRELQGAINAYHIIGDPDRRSAYDASRSRRVSEAVGGTRIPVRHVPSSRQREAPGARRTGTPASRPTATVGDVVLTFDEAVRGATAVVDVEELRPCPSCRGRGEHPTDRTVCPACHGAGAMTRRSNRISIRQECTACHGQGLMPRPCPQCDATGVVASSWPVRVKIPAGVQDGTRIRIPGPGSSALYATVHVRPRDRQEHGR